MTWNPDVLSNTKANPATFNFGASGVSPTVVIDSVTSISYTGANVNFTVSATSLTIIERGVCYGLTVDPLITGSKVIVTGTTGAGTAIIAPGNLVVNTGYHARAYVKLDTLEVIYSDDQTFSTLNYTVPHVTTGTITLIAPTTALVAGEVVDNGGDPGAVSARGVVWSTSPDPTLANNHVDIAGAIGTFSCQITNLPLDSQIYTRAYATNAQGTAYGNSSVFVTPAGAPVWTFVDKKELTYTGSAGWQVMDLSAIVPSGTKTIILEAVNTSPDTRYGCNVRPTGSAMNRAPYLQFGTHVYFMVGLDSARTFSRLFANTAIRVFLVAHSPLVRTIASPYVDKSLTLSTYADIDCSASVPAAAKTAFFEAITTASSAYNWAIRPKAAAWDHYYGCQSYGSAPTVFSGLDVNRIAEGRVSNANFDFYLLGWGEDEIVSITPVTKTPTTTGWQTINVATECPGAIGVLIKFVNTAGTAKLMAAKGVNDVWDVSASCNMIASSQTQAYVPVDAYGDFMAYVGTDTAAKIDIHGYIRQPANMSVETGALTNITKVSATVAATSAGTGILERGVCWDTEPDPTVSDHKIVVAGTTGAYSADLIGLPQGTRVYARSYVTDQYGTAYGMNAMFMTAWGFKKLAMEMEI